MQHLKRIKNEPYYQSALLLYFNNVSKEKKNNTIEEILIHATDGRSTAFERRLHIHTREGPNLRKSLLILGFIK